ncbi:hypothetical protein LEP1GSC125_2808 [Leptospira mayottensis 200901122]|uniref:Uncharacterized protein n=1 Tax=Leptospira mayottensis 200901122 TaxID=1193010 RepID=A0AA87SVE7_9LEPT|nr:hypothetical protein LEP1GSC125_2808 [Leptospira mayottensis 200901122]
MQFNLFDKCLSQNHPMWVFAFWNELKSKLECLPSSLDMLMNCSEAGILED